MIRKLLLTAVVPLVIGAAVAVPVGLMLGRFHWTLAAIAFGLCVVPGLAVVALNDYLIRTSPYGRVAALFVGTLVRLAVGFGGGVAVFFLLALNDRSEKLAFWAWVLFAYLTTLAVETALFAKPLAVSRSDSRSR